MSINHTIMPADQETLAGWQAHFEKEAEAGEGMHTATELAGALGISKRAMQRRIEKLLETGEAVVAKAYRVDIFDRRQLVPVYKLVAKPKPKRRKK